MTFDLPPVQRDLKSEAVAGEQVITNWAFTDLDGDDSMWVLALENQAIHHIRGRHDDAAAVTVTISRDLLLDITGGDASFVDAVTDGRVTLDGDPAALITIFGNLDSFETGFPIVEP